MSTLCHGCGFSCQQKVLKTFPGPGYLCSEDGVVWLWHLLVNLYMAHHFILLRLSPFDLKVDREGWWFEHSVSWLRVCFSAEGAKNVSWPWLFPLWGWGSLTMTFTGKFVFIYICYFQKITHTNIFSFTVIDSLVFSLFSPVWLLDMIAYSISMNKTIKLMLFTNKEWIHIDIDIHIYLVYIQIYT